MSKVYGNSMYPYPDCGNCPLDLRDYGPAPFVINLAQATLQNTNYRTALWTGCYLQLTLMSINVGEDIGLEMHPYADQFIGVESGQGLVRMGNCPDNVTFQRQVADDDIIMIPAGTWHNVINTGNRPLKLYSIYGPPLHPRGTIEVTRPEEHH
ncbi:MAG TPA: cupin domain-containing protein [Firmicutes bacterium]|nr:cupin domain-containing protein [Bacillota bacterium]HBR34244.1 cupin domain-containing protein [Bacillota bacterium]